jgi:hypothetical protein
VKKKIIIVVIVLLVIAVVLAILLPSLRWKVLGNMRKDVAETKSSSTEFSFQGQAGDRIKVSLRTTVEAGVVDFYLFDSEGNVVEEFDYADALETFVDLKNDDTYTLTAEYIDFSGKFSGKVSIERF